MLPLEDHTIEIAGQTYRVGRLNAKMQLHVFRRLGPILAAVGKSAKDMISAHGSLVAAESQGASLNDLLGPVMDELSKMKDADVDYIIDACLSCCGRKEGERFANLMRGTTLVYQDIDMPVMLRLTIEVLKENLGNFF